MDLYAFSLALIGAFFWSIDQTTGKLAIKSVNVTLFNTIRPLSALPFLVVFGILTKSLSVPSLKVTIIGGLAGLGSWFFAVELYFHLLKKNPVHKILPISNTTPLWAAIGPILILGEKIETLVIPSICLVFVGSYFLSSTEKEVEYFDKSGALALLPAVIWGFMFVPAKYCLNTGISAITYLVIALSGASIGCIVSISIRYIKFDLNLKTSGNFSKGLGLSIFSGIIGFFVGQTLYYSALGIEKASVLAPISGSPILFGFLISIFLFKEEPSLRDIIGTIFVFLGVFLATI